MEDWSFQESYIWSNNYPKCSSDTSPINIDTDKFRSVKLCSFDLVYKQ